MSCFGRSPYPVGGALGWSQKSPHRYTGNRDLEIGQYAIYRARFILAGDLVGAWGEFGGLTAQINHLATVLDIAITDHARIAVAYDRRIHTIISKSDLGRPANTGYYGHLSPLHAGAKAAVLLDFETKTGPIKKGEGNLAKEKEKKTA